MNVLIVDDQPRIARVTAIALEVLECRPFIAHTTAEASGLLASEKMDVIFLDVNLTGECGWDFLSQMIARPLAPPVVVFTALSMEEAADEAQRRGAIDCFVKPFSLDDLRQQLLRIKHYLRKQEGTRSHCP